MSSIDATEKVAWTVEIHNETCVVFATTRSKAQWIATNAYWDAFGKNEGWPRAKAWRAKPYDKSRLRFEHGRRAYSEDYVQGCLDA